MALMSGSLYRALKAADVPDDLAQKAAEDAADFEKRFARIDTRLAVLQWMVTIQFAGVAALVMKTFF